MKEKIGLALIMVMICQMIMMWYVVDFIFQLNSEYNELIIKLEENENGKNY